MLTRVLQVAIPTYTDDPHRAITRAQRRDRCVFIAEQATFMRSVCALFEQVAATDPARYRVVDRRTLGEHHATQLIGSLIQNTDAGLTCVNSLPVNRKGSDCTVLIVCKPS